MSEKAAMIDLPPEYAAKLAKGEKVKLDFAGHPTAEYVIRMKRALKNGMIRLYLK